LVRAIAHASTLTREAQILARACGKSHFHNLEPEDLAARIVEAAAGAALADDWIPGRYTTILRQFQCCRPGA
jgi:methylamine---glutamate N-methyltransferase subunit C